MVSPYFWFVVVNKNGSVITLLVENAVRPGNPGTDAMKQAPIVIAACTELNKTGYRGRQPTTDKDGHWYLFDAGLALENRALAAESFGLGRSLLAEWMPRKQRASLACRKGTRVSS